jgi:hypothetical protein
MASSKKSISLALASEKKEEGEKEEEQKRDFFEQILEDVEDQAITYYASEEHTSLSLEARRDCREKVEKSLQTLLKISKDLEEEEKEEASSSYSAANIKKTVRLTRHNELRNELQELYNGEANNYDPTAGGSLFPPHGMCPTDSMLKIVESFHAQITTCERLIQQLEDELKRNNPYVPTSPHPMIVLQSGETPELEGLGRRRMLTHQEKRNEIIHKIANAIADKRIAQEGLDFWQTSVRPATQEYMQKINDMFIEKNKLRHQLLVENGIAIPSW